MTIMSVSFLVACEDKKSDGDTDTVDSAVESIDPAVAEEAKKVDDAINAIGEVTLDSGTLIKTARDAYDKCSDEAKNHVEGLTALENAEKAFSDMQIKNVSDLVSKIGTVTLESKDAIKTAKDAYAALTAEQQAKVENYSVLQSAEIELDTLVKAEKEAAKKALLGKFNATSDKVTGVTWYEHKTIPKYIDIRSYLLPYIGIKGTSPWLCIRYNYTGDDWVFWKTLTISVDGNNYYKIFSYYDIVRDNEYGNVWEYYDEALDYNEPMDSSTIEMLTAIVNSKETIVRFQGSDYYDDITISKADKTAIKETLRLYEALLP